MSKLPVVSARRMESLLLGLGFSVARTKGGHVFYRHPDGRTTTTPHHAGRDLARPLIRKILADVGLSPDDYTWMVTGQRP